MNLIDRANRYVAQLPAAVAGSRGHDATLRAACVLFHGFALSDDDALDCMRVFNARCLPPWSERELAHKVKEASRITHREPRGYLLKGNPAPMVKDEPPRVIGRITLPEVITVITESEPPEPTPQGPDDAEAERIAGELVKIHQAGHITGPDDPNAVVLAGAMKMFNGRYVGGGK